MKALRDILIIFGLVVLWASTSRPAMKFITEHRDTDAWWGSYPCKHGDLVSLSYLDFVPQFNPPESRTKGHLKNVSCNSGKTTVLVLHGDSNTWHVGDSNFVCVSPLYYINRTNGGYYHLDKSKRNVMVIEVAERYLRSYFMGLQILKEVYDSGTVKQIVLDSRTGGYSRPCFAAMPGIESVFNPLINQNLQCNLFNYNFIMPMFECKAALNYYLFNRASGDVVISDDRKCLFLRETVAKTGTASSYTNVSYLQVQQIVSTLNTIYDYYRSKGFNEVYFSIIPNPATILQPQGYNNLIPLVQHARALKMKIIDIYSVFRDSSELCYLTGDTHWNMKGKQLWIDMVNARLLADQNN